MMMAVVVKSDIRGGRYLLDCYMGRTIRSAFSHAITTRTATDNNTFVLEIDEEQETHVDHRKGR